ncbi:MAG: SEC-C metal-binding domain-containing protein [Pseudomonadota bacterium]
MEESKPAGNATYELNDSCCSDASCCPPQTPVTRLTPKVGRNDPCPCESGRKYKKCCGAA